MTRRTNAASPPIPKQMVPRYWHYLIFTAAGIVDYWPSLRGVFLLDDDVYIVGNPDIKQLWPLRRHLAAPDRGVLRLTLALNYAIGGIKPLGFHIFNLAIHLFASLTLYGLVRRTIACLAKTNRPSGKLDEHSPEIADAANARSAGSLAFAVALVWVIHPLTTQAVTYVIQRSESMMALFYLLTLYCVARGATAVKSWPWYVAAIISCGAGMGCKPVMVTVPLVVLIYDRLFLAESWRNMMRKRWWVYLVLAAEALSSGALEGVVAKEPNAGATVGFGYRGISPWEYLISQPGVILHYLRLAVWPRPLCFDYDWPPATISVTTGMAGVLILGLLAATVWGLSLKRRISFLGAAFFIVLAPTSSFVPIKDLAVEHRMYLPLAAVIALIVLASDRLSRSASKSWRTVVLGTAALVLGGLTIQRNRVYGSAIDLWGDVIAQRPNNARAWSHLGNAQMEAHRLDDAIASFRASLQAKPDWAEIENNLGNALAQAGRLDEAAEALKNALAHSPVLTHVHFNYAIVLQKLGRSEEAIEHYRAGLAATPQLVPPRINLADALRAVGRLPEAEAEMRTAIQYAPNNPAAHFALGYMLELQGKFSEASAEYRQVLALQPNHADARARLAGMNWK
jgi:Flp pilus assembly protein TadD